MVLRDLMPGQDHFKPVLGMRGPARGEGCASHEVESSSVKSSEVPGVASYAVSPSAYAKGEVLIPKWLKRRPFKKDACL